MMQWNQFQHHPEHSNSVQVVQIQIADPHTAASISCTTADYLVVLSSTRSEQSSLVKENICLQHPISVHIIAVCSESKTRALAFTPRCCFRFYHCCQVTAGGKERLSNDTTIAPNLQHYYKDMLLSSISSKQALLSCHH